MKKNKNEKLFLGKRKKKSKFWLWFVIILFLVLSIAVSVYFFVFSSFFKVKSVEVIGGEHIDKNVLLSALTAEMTRDYKWRSWLGAENILFWQFGKRPIVKNDTLPYFKDLSLDVNFSAKKVMIYAKERQPAGVFCSLDENCFVFDDEGVLFAKAPDVEGSLILKIQDENKADVVLGNMIFKDFAWVKNLLQTIEIIDESGFRIKAVNIKDSNLQEWEVLISSGETFLFNLNFVPENLAEILKDLPNKVDFKNLNYIDFRVPSRIYYK